VSDTTADVVEFPEDASEPFFVCPILSLGPFVAFLCEEGVAIEKVESGIHPDTGEDTRFVFIGADGTSSGPGLAGKFNSSAR
jgi:hypothetical protein